MQYSCTVVIVSRSEELALRRAVNTPFARCFADARLESLGGELGISGELQLSRGLAIVGVCRSVGLSANGNIEVSNLSSCLVGELLRDV